MIIRVAIVDGDRDCLRGIVNSLDHDYQSRLEIYAYSSPESINEQLKKRLAVDVILVSQDIDPEQLYVGRDTSVVYLVEGEGISQLNGLPAICKYVRNDRLYNLIISLYSSAHDITLARNEQTRIITFMGAGGGVGTTAAALAFCRFQARRGKKTLYLALDPLGATPPYFEKPADHNLSEVIYEMHKNEGESIGFVIEGMMSQDSAGVRYLGGCEMVSEIADIDRELLEKLTGEISSAGGYDYIVLDTVFDFKNISIDCLLMSEESVIVTGDTPYGAAKCARLTQALKEWGEMNQLDMSRRTCVLVSQARGNGRGMDSGAVPVIGSLEQADFSSYARGVDTLSRNPVWDKMTK